MNNDQIRDFKFDDLELDAMADFDYCARRRLIKREISKREYLEIEKCLNSVRNFLRGLGPEAKSELRNCLAGY